MTRHESRCEAVCLLFEYSFGGDRDEIVANAVEYREETVSDYARSVYGGVIDNLPEIDALIADAAENRSFRRIMRLPLAVMRSAVYEMKFAPVKTPKEIAVNEALDICREYGDDDSTGFVNGVLGKIANNG